MATHADWLQRGNEALKNQSGLTVNHLTPERLTAYGIAGASAEWIEKEFVTKQQTFSSAVMLWLDPSERTPAKTTAVNDAKTALIPVYRELYGLLKHNPAVTNEDLVKMGLPARSTDKPTPSPVPSSYPDVILDGNGPRSIRATFRDHGAKTSTAKPRGVGGAVMKWAVLPAPPTSVNELGNSALDTKSPYVFTFDESQRGQTLYVAAAWQNTRGEMGKYSEIVSAIIS